MPLRTADLLIHHCTWGTSSASSEECSGRCPERTTRGNAPSKTPHPRPLRGANIGCADVPLPCEGEGEPAGHNDVFIVRGAPKGHGYLRMTGQSSPSPWSRTGA